MGFETLPGYDAWKTAAPECRDDYEAGLRVFAGDAGELCEENDLCPWALWSEDGESFLGCGRGVTGPGFRLTGDGEECLAVQAKAADFDAAAYYADLDADSRNDF